jgi:hypothetical protein
MSDKAWKLTESLLDVLKRLEKKNEVLKSNGITIMEIEGIQMDLIITILDINRISRDDQGVDYFTHPAFMYMWSEIDLPACITMMQERHAELKLLKRSG